MSDSTAQSEMVEVPDAYADRKLALMNIDRAIEKRKTA